MPNPLSRRRLLRGGASLAAVGGTAWLASGCATNASDDNEPAARGTADASNPLGVAPDAPLEVVIFKGGYDDAYAKFAESLYQERFPDAEITHQGIQDIAQTMQPRLVGGDPPDVIDNAGDGQMDMATLITGGQLADLTELFDAPSIDDPAVKVRDTITPGVIESNLVDGAVYQLNYVSTVFGFYYDQKLFTDRGWTYPATWDELLALCAEIQDAGIAPWTYQGKYPGYWTEQIITLIGKAGGVPVIEAIDNLEPDAWRDPSVLAAVEALYQLAERGYLLPGTEGLTHTEAQTAWASGEVAFIPCGSWIENEMSSILPEDFQTTVGPTPSISSADALPHTAMYAGSSESFIVPAQAANLAGGMEFLRILLSLEAGNKFAELTGALPVIRGVAEDVALSPGLAAARAALDAAGDNVFFFKLNDWYAELGDAIAEANGALMTGETDPAGWVDRVQEAADRIANDDSIEKFQR